MMTAMTLAAVAGSALGQAAVLRSSLRTVALASLALIASGSLMLTQLPVQGGAWRIVFALVLLGMGVGAAFVAGQIAVVSAAPETASLRLSALTDASFSIGGAAGLVVLGVVLARATTASAGAPTTGVLTGLQGGFTVATGITVLGFLAAVALPRESRSTVHNGAGRPSQ
jgi:hypothetical protein